MWYTNIYSNIIVYQNYKRASINQLNLKFGNSNVVMGSCIEGKCKPSFVLGFLRTSVYLSDKHARHICIVSTLY